MLTYFLSTGTNLRIRIGQKLIESISMSNSEAIVKADPKSSHTNGEIMISESFEFDRRSQEMLLVLNEVFDAIIPSTNS